MKVVSIREARDNISTVFSEAQDEPLLILRHGRPLVVVHGVSGLQVEEIQAMRFSVSSTKLKPATKTSPYRDPKARKQKD